MFIIISVVVREPRGLGLWEGRVSQGPGTRPSGIFSLSFRRNCCPLLEARPEAEAPFNIEAARWRLCGQGTAAELSREGPAERWSPFCWTGRCLPCILW